MEMECSFVCVKRWFEAVRMFAKNGKVQQNHQKITHLSVSHGANSTFALTERMAL
jgi:hypothetical protein